MSERNELPELPKGWCWATLADCALRITDGTHQPPTFVESGIPFIFVQHIVGGSISFEHTRFISDATYRQLNSRCPVERGDILYSAVGSYGVAVPVQTEQPFSFQRHIAHIKPSRRMSQAYLVNCLNSPQCLSQAHAAARGVAQKTVTLGDLARFVIPVAPLAEQRRIVEAIEQQFTRLDAGVAALKRTQAALKRYRTAVLKAAVEGKLTEAWRAAHPDAEPASTLLARTLAERRARWGADLRASGKDPAKAKYDEPQAPDTTELPELPAGWRWATVEPSATLVTDGDHNPPKRVEEGVPHLTAKNVVNSRLQLDGCTYVTREDAERVFQRYRPEPGDLLVTCVGTIGRTAIVPEGLVFSPVRNLAAIRAVLGGTFAKYLEYWLLSPQMQRAMSSASGSTAQPHLYLKDIRALPVPLAPSAEQVQIVAEVERRLSVVSELEAAVAANLKRAERLRQSILERAFSGRLVSQDPRDEPASALLERIRDTRSVPPRRNEVRGVWAAAKAPASLWEN